MNPEDIAAGLRELISKRILTPEEEDVVREAVDLIEELFVDQLDADADSYDTRPPFEEE